MNIWESFVIALSSIWNHKVRSVLTMLGIIIGVGAVIIIVAIGEGAKADMTESMFSTDDKAIELNYEPNESEDGSEMMWEEPKLTSLDIEALQKVPGVKSVIGTNEVYGEIMHKEKKQEISITGVGAEYFSGKDMKIVDGRAFNERDGEGTNRIVMIDTVIKKKLFKGKDKAIGEIIEISDNPYKIVGVYESATPEMFRGDRGEAMMPRALITMMFGADEIQKISIFGESADTLSETGLLAAEKLTELKNLEDGHYTTFDMSEFDDEFDSFFTTITIFISSIAGISLLVGGIGVMNIMLVSVTERTREIGLRKALGATRGRILLQFLIEAVTLTSLGGIIGVGFAAIVTLIASQLLPFSASINPVVVVIGVSFSAFIGIVFGILPASKASKLSPIAALRHE